MSIVSKMGVQSDHESGYFEGDDVIDDDDLEIIHEEIVNPGPGLLRQREKGLS